MAELIPPMAPGPAAWHDVPRGRVLAFAPHPDDEVAGPGGCLALHAVAGDAVRVVVASDGAAGDPQQRYKPGEYTSLRQRESRAGCKELGIADLHFWGLPDNMVLTAADLERGMQLASRAIHEFAADILYLPWAQEGHSDHHALHHVVLAAMDRIGYRGRAFGYEVWNAMIPNYVVNITSVAERKRAAIAAHTSQLAYTDFQHTILGLNAYRSMVHQQGRGYAEALCEVR